MIKQKIRKKVQSRLNAVQNRHKTTICTQSAQETVYQGKAGRNLSRFRRQFNHYRFPCNQQLQSIPSLALKEFFLAFSYKSSICERYIPPLPFRTLFEKNYLETASQKMDSFKFICEILSPNNPRCITTALEGSALIQQKSPINVPSSNHLLQTAPNKHNSALLYLF